MRMLKRRSSKQYDPFKILLIAEFILVLALLPWCFQKEKQIVSFNGDDIGKMERAEGDAMFCSERFVLESGVYRLRIWTDLAEQQQIYVQMNCDEAYFKSLRNNGLTIFPGNDYQDFEVYVLDKISTAYVQCNFSGADSDGLVRVEVWKTGMGGRMLYFIVLVSFVVLDFLVIFRRRILAGKVTRKQQVVFWTLTAAVLTAYFPYLTDYFVGGDDVFFHLSRIAYLADAIKQGASWPVRVEGTWLSGHGYASSIFYGDLFLLVPAFLRLIGFSIMSSYKIFLLLVTAATACVSYFSFQKCVKDEYAALFGSLVYLLAPYRLYNVYSRAAVGEYLAMIFLPLVCCGMYLLCTEDPASEEYGKCKWYVVWGMSGVLQSHLISTEMAALLILISCVIFCKKIFRRKTVSQLAEATGLVLLINAWFWVPLLYMLRCDSYHIQEITEADMQFTGLLVRNFFYWLPYTGARYAAKNDVWVGVGAVALLLFYAVWRYKRKKKDVADMFAMFSVLTLIMSTAYFPWNAVMKIPGIGYVAASLQFPWRWMSPAALFLALLAVFLFRRVMEEGGMSARAVLGVVAAVTAVSAVYHVNSTAYGAPPIYLYNEENMGTANVGGGEYVLSETQISEIHYHEPAAEEGLTWTDYRKEGTNVTVSLENRTNEIRCIEIPLTGYKGYEVTAPGSETELPFVSEERGAHGDLRLAVPAGYQGTVRVSYKGFMMFHVAEAVSLGCLAVLSGMYFYRRKTAQKAVGIKPDGSRPQRKKGM